MLIKTQQFRNISSSLTLQRQLGVQHELNAATTYRESQLRPHRIRAQSSTTTPTLDTTQKSDVAINPLLSFNDSLEQLVDLKKTLDLHSCFYYKDTIQEHSIQWNRAG